MPEAIEYLEKTEGKSFNIIPPEKADETSRVNSKAMVLVSFVKNEYGYYQIQVQDKELYNYTQKLIKDIFRMRITDIDREHRVITAECDHKGIALQIIDVLREKYNLSIVVSGKSR
ncbi:MAG: hypothetical protein J6I84_04805 [Bacilli bacterium]|nr:hypothetical protein [Bacilli bacterium]